MTQYISKDAVIENIDNLVCNLRYTIDDEALQIDILDKVRNFINTLEVKEVDFETAFVASIDHFDEKNNYGQWPESDLREFAEHFFELGLKMKQKGE